MKIFSIALTTLLFAAANFAGAQEQTIGTPNTYTAMAQRARFEAATADLESFDLKLLRSANPADAGLLTWSPIARLANAAAQAANAAAGAASILKIGKGGSWLPGALSSGEIQIACVSGTSLTTGASFGGTTVPLATTLGGLILRFNGAAPAPLFWVGVNNVANSICGSNVQINFQTPIIAQTGDVMMEVGMVANGTTTWGTPAHIAAVPNDPSLFQWFPTAGGAPTPIVQMPHQFTASDSLAVNTSANRVKLEAPGTPYAGGAYIRPYLTGLGSIAPPTGQQAPIPGTATPTGTFSVQPGMLGNSYLLRQDERQVPGAILFLGLTPGSVGLGQADVLIPKEFVTPNTDVDFILVIGGTKTQIVTVHFGN